VCVWGGGGEHHAVNGLPGENEELVRDASPPVLLQDGPQVAPHGVRGPPVPRVVVGGLVTGQHVDEALLLGASKHRRGVGLADVGVEGVRVVLRQHVPAGREMGCKYDSVPATKRVRTEPKISYGLLTVMTQMVSLQDFKAGHRISVERWQRPSFQSQFIQMGRKQS